MGRWLEALKKHENADEGHPQNPQKFDEAVFDDPAVLGEVQEPPHALPVAVPAPQTATARQVGRNAAPSHPNPVRAIMERLEGDMERYAEALRTYGPMSYGQAMQVLGWGATRAGCAESDLCAAGRIAFNQLGRAYLVEEETGHDQ